MGEGRAWAAAGAGPPVNGGSHWYARNTCLGSRPLVTLLALAPTGAVFERGLCLSSACCYCRPLSPYARATALPLHLCPVAPRGRSRETWSLPIPSIGVSPAFSSDLLLAFPLCCWGSVRPGMPAQPLVGLPEGSGPFTLCCSHRHTVLLTGWFW